MRDYDHSIPFGCRSSGATGFRLHRCGSGWCASWKPKGYALAFIEGLVRENLNNEPIPFALVAHVEGTFLGTASVIASDFDSRPQYTRWVAALWVDPAHRSNEVGTALVRQGAEMAQDLGFDPAYLRPTGQARVLPTARLATDRGGVTEAGLAVFQSP